MSSKTRIETAWTPADAEQLRRDLATLPVDTDDSPILRLICAEQGIEL